MDPQMKIILPLVAIMAPLAGALLIVMFKLHLGERSARIGISALVCSALASISTLVVVLQEGTIPPAAILVGLDAVNYTVHVDRLAAIMMVLVSLVSLVIHVYSTRYMVGDQGFVRFFALLGMLTFVLLGLVTSGNLLWMFVWWHLITWLLATLLAFNPASRAAKEAGRRTLWVQGIGDATFGLALAVLYGSYGTLDLTELFDRLQAAPAHLSMWPGIGSAFDVVSLASVLLLIAVMTKSAQFPFHIWLPGTIEAPTPVSALLHAGIVNAGGFLVNRLAPLFGLAPMTLHLMFVIGGVTVLIGAATMLTQSSIKRTLVYSTMGQMGYMVMECGLGAFALAVFHLCAHGLFKATLFLNSGANIHKSRADFKLPPGAREEGAGTFSPVAWATGFTVTLVLPLIILLAAHGFVRIALLDEQGAVIFLFFGWVTSSQAVFSLYRLNAVASWKVSLMMLAALALIGLTYLWAGQAFTHVLYPGPGESARYFRAAEWDRSLFDTFVLVSTMMVIAVWILIYGKAHGVKLLMPAWAQALRTRAYVAFLHGLYVEDLVRALGRRSRGL
jgi:NADH-quinone oxidoreductase subunit L